MRYKRFMRSFYVFFSMLCLFVMLCIPVRADTSVDASCGVNASALSGICAQANAVVGNNAKILKYEAASGKKESVLYFSNQEYSKLDTDTRKAFMKKALKLIAESNMGTQAKAKAYNFIADQDAPVTQAIRYLQSDASADLAEARNWLRPFSGLMGTIMGVVALMTFIFLTASVIFDLAYLSLPMVQGILEHGEENKRPFGVSREAYRSLRDVEKNPKFKGILSVYFSRRLPVFIGIGICLGYIVSGNIYDFIVFFVDNFSLQ